MKFSIAHKDDEMMNLVKNTDKKLLAVWAKDCAERVMHFYNDKFPNDPRPRMALEALQRWIDTGVFSMKVIRGTSLDAHAAAREAEEDSSARSAARAAGQAVATAHVATHAYGSAIYAQQAIFRTSNSADAEAAAAKERDWQYQHLVSLTTGPTY